MRLQTCAAQTSHPLGSGTPRSQKKIPTQSSPVPVCCPRGRASAALALAAPAPSTAADGAGTSAPVSIEILREYIAFARATCKPKLTPEAAQKLANAYADMRALGMSRKTVSATPRQLESLIRLSEGSARIRLSEWVEERDVLEAVRLMQVSMQQASIDPKTGQIDMDVIQTGVSAADRTARVQLAAMIKDILETKNAGSQGVRVADLVDTLATVGIRVSDRQVDSALSLELQGDVRVREGRAILLR